MYKDRFYFMKKAIDLAKIAETEGEVPVGAILVLENQIIGAGYNRVIGDSDPTAHAEMVALRKAGAALNNYRLLNTELYVTLEPCLMCYSAMVHARVSKLYFGAFDEKTGIFSGNKFESMQNIYNHHIEVLPGVLQEETSQQLTNFFKNRRRSKKENSL